MNKAPIPETKKEIELQLPNLEPLRLIRRQRSAVLSCSPHCLPIIRATKNPMIHPEQLGEAYPVPWDTSMPSTRILRPSARQNTVRAVEPEVLLQPPTKKIKENHQPLPLEHSLMAISGFVHTSVWDPQNVTATLVSPESMFCAAPRLRPATGCVLV